MLILTFHIRKCSMICTTSITERRIGRYARWQLLPAKNWMQPIQMTGVVAKPGGCSNLHTQSLFFVSCGLTRFSKFKHMTSSLCPKHVSSSHYHSEKLHRMEVSACRVILWTSDSIPVKTSSHSFCTSSQRQIDTCAQSQPMPNG